MPLTASITLATSAFRLDLTGCRSLRRIGKTSPSKPVFSQGYHGVGHLQ
jgi:hypothetical protein